MAEKVLTKKTFIGHGAAGRLALPGEEVDVDEKGVVSIAGSTPIGNMTDDQIEAELERRRGGAKAEKREPDFGGNVADPGDADTGTQRLEMAPFRPSARGDRPQGIPPGTEEHQNTFVRPAPADSDAAVEVIVGEGADAALTDDGKVATGTPEERAKADGSAFDHDGDGKPGGAPKGGNRKKS